MDDRSYSTHTFLSHTCAGTPMTLKELVNWLVSADECKIPAHNAAIAWLKKYKPILDAIPEIKEGVPHVCHHDDGDLILCNSCMMETEADFITNTWPLPDDPENYPVACEYCHTIFSR